MRDGAKTKFARQLRQHLTSAEMALWARLRRRQIGNCRFRRQHPIGPFIADFACIERRLIVEVDGATHSTDAEREADTRRTRWLEENGWRIVRATNPEIYQNIDGVLEGVRIALLESR